MSFNQSDANLVDQLNEHDLAAFKSVYNQYWVVLYQHARRILGEDTLAEDIVQDIFIRLHQKMGSLNPDLDIRKWLYSCVRHRAIDELRKDKVRKQYVQQLDRRLNSQEPIPDQYVLEKELNAQIDAEIAKLPPKTRQVFELRWRNSLSHREIAAATSASVETVRKQVQNAVKKLRDTLHRIPILMIAAIPHLLQRLLR
jgi:RNA polymerase sigma-70 factor, ECF subfamily